MAVKVEEVVLADGTLVRHRVSGYLGRIDGVTAIQSCFTNRGSPMATLTSKDDFQYRIVVQGQTTRRIAPVRDLEVLATAAKMEVTCLGCNTLFTASPSLIDKPSGLCECGGWICPQCLVCQPLEEISSEPPAGICPNQRKRLLNKSLRHKRAKGAQTSIARAAKAAAPRFRN